ncbi:MAG: Rgg/GadR/MutR family transcriptional regulator [Streptococcus sp.]|nr:Rgg/GadR/MutR family transcriptional regulator [Streptococcus sp.]
MELGKKVELGELYKELRMARGLKQKEVAKGNLTTSQLSKFETGLSMLSADKMITAIEGIYMTFEEFGHALNDYQSTEFQKLSERVVYLFMKKDIATLQLLLEEYQEKSSNSLYARLFTIWIKNTIHSLDNEYPILEEDAHCLTNYLYSIEAWTGYELHLFGNTMPIFSDMDLIFLGKELVKRSEIYLSLTHYKQNLKFAYLNLISELLTRKKAEYMDIFIQELEPLLTYFDTFEMILLRFLKLMKKYCVEKTIQRQFVETYISDIDKLGLEEIASLLQLRLEQYERYFV